MYKVVVDMRFYEHNTIQPSIYKFFKQPITPWRTKQLGSSRSKLNSKLTQLTITSPVQGSCWSRWV
jgi:hypothetical protein